ncbi:MAG: endolytic transglycosylase MltG [Blastocatellia bacterium]
MKKAVLILFLVLVMGAIAATAGVYLWVNQSVSTPQAHAHARETFIIEPRTSTSTIISRLHRDGVLTSEWPMWIWMKTAARGQSFKSGSYEFKSPISPLEIIGKLVRGEVTTRSVTIPEGYNQWDIAAKLAAPLPGMNEPAPASPDAILALFKSKVSLVRDLDSQATDLEGYLFPDTYEYTVSTTREQIVDAMVKRFRRVWTADWQQKARAMGMTTRQAVTMASLVEKEARVDKEREIISQVYHKRWKIGEKLACDPTVLYAAHLVGKMDNIVHRSDLDRDSPYNTYKRAGLPPGPIASPGKRSLEAALNPASTNFLYFVVDATRRDGSHFFSEKSGDHDAAVGRYREWEREQASGGTQK